MTATGVSVLCNAAGETFSASPPSCNVGDTITLTYSGGFSGSTYQYSYSTNNGSTWVSITSGFSDITTYSFVPSEEGTFIFKAVIKYSSGALTNKLSNSVIVSSAESSAESSTESSTESSFTPMSWLPGWNGQQYVQPSYDSTPELSIGDTSFLTAEYIDTDFISIITGAFGAFPPALIAVLPAVILSLFLGWWLHK